MKLLPALAAALRRLARRAVAWVGAWARAWSPARLRVHPLWVGLPLLLVGVLVWQLARAATLTVSTTSDVVDGDTSSISALLANPGSDGKISLREAILAANNSAASGPHTIVLPAGTYSRTAGVMAVTASLTIQGDAQATTVINITDSARGFTTSTALTLTGLTLQNGVTTSGAGGCVQVSGGSLSISNSTLSGCQAQSGLNGGAIATLGTSMSLSAVVFSGNSSSSGSGGAIALGSGTLTISRSTFSSNTAPSGTGGALWVNTSASATVTDSTFSSNSAGSGGAITMASSSTLSVTGATFATNSAGSGTGGAVAVTAGTSTLTNVTLNGNSSSASGGAVAVSGGTATLTNVTVAGNSSSAGAGGLVRTAGTLSLRNTLVSANTGSAGNCSGTITNTSNNLDSGTTCGFGTANGSLSSSNPVLSALASNGGPTQTMALGAGSPAVNAGTATSAPATDQRGYGRVGTTDIGAFEYGATAGALTLSGTVFEDVNYGGGAGRTLAASGGAGLGNATVELYDSTGTYLYNTTTSAGAYSFTGLAAGTYYVRVVNGTVASQRSGTSGSLVGVQTFRVNASGGSAVAVTDSVGGTNPALADAGSASSGAAFSPSTGVYNTGLSGTAQSVAPVTLSAGNVAGVDFGFNFDTVVNTNDTGPGSLRQAITNANALGGDNALAQAGRTGGIENLIFMISNGTTGSGGSLSLVGGLRTAYNYFTTSAGSYNVATLAPASGFPALTSPLVIDAQAQPGWTAAPLLEINGGDINMVVFTLSAGSSTLRGFVINRVNTNGAAADVRIDTLGGNTVQGNWLGLGASGATANASANACQLLSLYAGNNVVGGTTASARNVISAGYCNGIVVWAGDANKIQGNYIGTNAAGTAALGSKDSGIAFPASSTATNTVIGGTAAGEGNVISGNSGFTATTGGISIQGASATGTRIQGNSLGLNAAGSGTIASGGYGLYVASASTTIGGTATGAGNTITAYSGKGVAVVGSTTTGVVVEGNSIYGNTGIGIDLNNDGATANAGSKTANQPNLLMNTPVFRGASISGSALVVAGYVGSTAGQSTFAGARVEVFIADASSAAGSGKTLLGTLTTDASGNFSGTFSGVVSGASGITAGTTPVTGTATDTSNNTSEFGPNATVGYAISGTVFEDADYGGGAGRSLSGAGGTGASGATVELYNSAGTYVASTTSASGGSYSFTGLGAGTYYVRVVSSSVLSQRSGATSSLVGVQTFRTDASSGSAVAVANYVGGTDPALVDPGAASSGAAFNTSTFIYSAGLSGTAQAVAPVTIGSSGVSGVDFGFNFDTVVNTNDTGPGSLRQAMTNANALGGDSSLVQSGRTAAIENIVFMIPNGTTGGGGSLGLAGGGLRTGYNEFTTSAGSYNVATIAPGSALPSVTTAMVIDAQTQPGWTANPIIDLTGASAGAVNGFTLAGGGTTLRGMVIRNFSGGNGAVYIPSGNGNTVQGCWIGLTAAGTAAAGNTYGVWVTSAGNLIGGATATARNVIAGSNGSGVVVWIGADSNTFQGNYIGLNAAGTAAVGNGQDGLVIFGTHTAVGGVNAGEGNVIAGNNTGNAASQGGLEVVANGSAVIQGNLFGLKADGSAPIGSNGWAVISRTSGNTVGGTATGAGNTLTAHTMGGVSVEGSSNGVAIEGNSIYGNGPIGIDLGADGPTPNDGAKSPGQPNLLMDTPVFTSASLNAGTLAVTGYVGSAANQSLFASARVEVFIADASNTKGQGKTYLGFVTTDANGNFNGTIANVSGITAGSSKITGTATDASNNTSEFGPNLPVGYTVSGTVFEDANYGGGAGRSLSTSGGTGASGATVEIYNSAGSYVSSAPSTSGGAYSFTGLAAGTYYIRVVSSSVLSQRSGASSSLAGVLTFRTDATSGSAVAVTDDVGGTNPALVDPGAAGSGAAFNTATFVYSAGLSGTAQAVAPVTLGSSGASGVDFGFNFDTVVNTNDSGQGSLRQAIMNANTLAGDSGLAQAGGRSAGIENIVFMISNGTTGSGGSLGLTGGLRSTLNYFGTSAGAYNVATIAPTSALPAITTTMVIDAQAQPGWTASPLVELRGDGAGSGVEGFQLNADSSVLRGLVINRFSNGGVYSNAGNGLKVQGCWIGLNAAGTAAAGNAASGIYFAGNGNNHVIGGTAASQRNVIAGNVSYDGIALNGGSGHLVQGNYIGTNAAGTATIANGRYGIVAYAGVGSSSIGGTAAGAGNVIAGNGSQGVRVADGVTGLAILRNSIYGNGTLGIDLGPAGVNANDGAKTAGKANLSMDYPVFTSATLSGSTLTVAGYVGSAAGQSTFASSRVEVFVSDGTFANGQGKTYLGYVTADANGNFNSTIPSVNGVVNGTTQVTGTATDAGNNTSEFGPNTTVGNALTGTVFEDPNYGGGAGRSLASSGGAGLSGATVELYDSSGVFVSSTTTAGGGGYSFSGLASATYYVRVVGSSVQSQRSGSTAALAGVMTFRTDASSGTAVAVTNYVGGTNPALVDPGAGSSGAAFNTATFVFSAGLSGTAQAVAPVTLGAGGSGSGSGIAGVDFGFNFDTVVNTNDSGQGSLRQAITNANTLGGDSALAQAGGRTAGIENIVFMIPNGTTGSGGSLGLTGGLRNTYNYFTTSAGSAQAATIAPASALPTLSSAVVVDAQTQPGWTLQPLIELQGSSAGSTPGLVLAAGSITVRGLVINRFGGDGLSVTAGGSDTLQGNYIGTDASGSAAAGNAGNGITLAGSGSAQQVGGTLPAQRNVVSGNTGYGVYVGGSGGAQVLQGNYIGTDASGLAAVGNHGRGVFIDSGVTSATLGGSASGAGNVVSGNPDYAVWLAGGPTTVQGNLIGLNKNGTSALANGYGMFVASGGHLIGGSSLAARNVISGNASRGIWLNGSANTVQGNYIGTDGAGLHAVPNQDGVYSKAAGNVISGNLISGNSRYGLQLNAIAGGTTVQGNTIGLNATASGAVANGVGIDVACSAGCAIGGAGAGQGNVISGNTGNAVQVKPGAAGNAILANAIYANGGLGIDLGVDGISPNDGAKTAGAANLLMDYPVLTAARARGSLLTVAGYIGTAAGQSLFAGSRVELFASDASAANGSGQTYLGTLTSDASGNFSGSFTMTQSRLKAGTVLTATATDTAGNTSEFSVNFTGLVVDWVVNSTGDGADASPGNGLCETSTAGECTLRAALMEANAAVQAGGSVLPTIAFALPGCNAAGAAGCTITPASALPSLANPVALDGTTQTGWALAGSACAPWVELNGSATAAGTNGLVVVADGATLRGLVVNRYNGSGVVLSGTGNLLACNYIGTTQSGLVAAGNGGLGSSGAGVNVTASGNTIGGVTATSRNVISGNLRYGITVRGSTLASGTLIEGNYIGLAADGATALGNGEVGVLVDTSAAGTQIGGVASGAGNVISGNGLAGIELAGSTVTGTLVQGNHIGSDASGVPLAGVTQHSLAGIYLLGGASGQQVGGTATGAGNQVLAGAGAGIGLAATARDANTLRANLVYGNAALGIDLGLDGVTTNTGTLSSSLPNQGMNFPVFTGAGYDAATQQLTVFGYIGSTSGQGTFGGATVELFRSDGDASGYGEGQVWLGTLTAAADGTFSTTLTVPAGALAVGDRISATATDAHGDTSEFGPQWATTTLAGLTPGGFNAFESSTPAGSLVGVIQTKTVGVTAALDVIALNHAGTALNTAFSGSVSLTWLDAHDNSGALDSFDCRSTWVAAGSAGTAVFANSGRVTVNLTPPTVGREWRLRMTYTPASGPPVVACSTDNFAIKPVALLFTAVGDTTDATPGSASGVPRSLTNASASGGVVHRAGQPFSLRAAGVDAANATQAGYDGVPTLALTGCVLPASGCILGSLSAGTLVNTGGVVAGDALTYSEVGVITMQLSDAHFADVDAADTSAAQRLVQSAPYTVGRFVPDHFLLATSTPGVLATADAGCATAGAGFTWVGQAFGWATAPQLLVTAQNASSGVTQNWTGSLMKLDAGSSIAPAMAASGTASSVLSSAFGPVSLTDHGNGTVSVLRSAADQFALSRSNSTPQASFTPTFGATTAVNDTSEVGVSGNAATGASLTQAPVAFNAGGIFHYGRLALFSGHGDARVGVRVLAELQKFTAAGWMRMAEDQGCVSIPPAALAYESGEGGFAGADICNAPVTAAVSTHGGRAWLVLPGSPGAVAGSLTLRLNLGASASGDTCVAAGTSAAAITLNQPLLQGAFGGATTLDQDPRAQATWGRAQREMLMRRELFF